MMKKTFKALAVVCAVMFSAAIPAGAQEFAADMVSRVGKDIVNAKIYVAPGKIRMEMPESTMIIRMDKNLSWMVMPSEQMYMEHPLDLASAPKVSKNFDGEIERVPMGSEDVDGKPADKFQVSYTENGKKASVYQWLRGSEIPVKVEAVDGSWSMEYKNLEVGTQPADLFEPPTGYAKFGMPSMGEMMKDLGGMFK